MNKKKNKIVIMTNPVGESDFFKKWIGRDWVDTHVIIQEKLDALEKFEDNNEAED
jgi:hypothetical protein